KILRRTLGRLFGFAADVDQVRGGQIDVQSFEPVRRTPRRAAPPNRRMALRVFCNDGLDFFPRHILSSHEHITAVQHFLCIAPLLPYSMTPAAVRDFIWSNGVME